MDGEPPPPDERGRADERVTGPTTRCRPPAAWDVTTWRRNPDPDDDPTPDPFEAELVAYLDGELDPAAARAVEERLANDPDARAAPRS